MSSDDIFYLDMDHLANFVDKAQDKIKDPGISRSAVIYKPLRDAIGQLPLLPKMQRHNLALNLKTSKQD